MATNRASALATADLAEIKTLRVGNWMVAGFRQIGTRHYDKGDPCQDAMAFGSLGNTVWAAVADGVSAARFAHHGAQIAVKMATERIYARLYSKQINLSNDLTKDAVHGAKLALQSHSYATGIPIADLATTLLIVVADDQHFHAAHIGDGGIYSYDGEHIETVAVTDNIDRVHHLSEDHALNHVAVYPKRVRRRPVKGFAMCTDGALGYFRRQVPGQERNEIKPSVIEQSFKALEQAEPFNFFHPFAGLAKHKGTQKDGDDRTLVLGLRIPEHLAKSHANPDKP